MSNQSKQSASPPVSPPMSTGESGDNVDRRVVEVKIALPADVIAKASRINYMQVNVVFDPLTPEQRLQRPTQP